MNNSIMSSKNAIVKNIIDAEPVLFGAGVTSSQLVKFAYGTLAKAAQDKTDGQIAFGYDETTKAGAIYVGGNLVTSKILDITKDDTQKVDGVTDGKAETITVTYVDAAGAVQSKNFAVVDQKLVQELITAQANKDNARLEALENYAKATNITAADGAVTVTPAGDFKTYTVGVNVDGKTVVKNAESKLAAGKTLAIKTGAELYADDVEKAAHKYITLTAADGKTVESTIDLCDIVGESLIKGTAYDSETGKLTITWKTADGTDATDASTVINLAEMLDINDMSVAEDSSNYLTVNLSGAENSQAIFTVHTKDVSTATAEATGLADAADVKAYVDSKVADVSAEGDDYVSASYDKNASKITVAADVSVLTVGKEGEANSTLTGVEKSLVDGKDVAEKVSSFVNARLSEEVAKLDSSVTSDDGAVATVKVVETDGKITDVVVTNISANVTSGGDAGARTLAAANDSGAVTGADVAKIKTYVDNRLSDMKSAQDSSVKASDSSYVSMEVVMTDGSLSSASIDLNVDATLTPTTGWNAGAVTDSAALKGYLDSSFNGMTATVTDKDGKEFVEVSTSQANGVITDTQVGVKYGTYGSYSVDSSAVTLSDAVDGVATVADTQKFVKSALTWTIL